MGIATSNTNAYFIRSRRLHPLFRREISHYYSTITIHCQAGSKKRLAQLGPTASSYSRIRRCNTFTPLLPAIATTGRSGFSLLCRLFGSPCGVFDLSQRPGRLICYRIGLRICEYYTIDLSFCLDPCRFGRPAVAKESISLDAAA